LWHFLRCPRRFQSVSQAYRVVFGVGSAVCGDYRAVRVDFFDVFANYRVLEAGQIRPMPLQRRRLHRTH